VSDSKAVAAFPPRVVDTIRVDSQAEELAYIAAWPHPRGAWAPAGWVFVPGIPGTQKHVTVRAPDQTVGIIRFLVGSYQDAVRAADDLPARRVEAAMRAGHKLAKAEGPLHPGTMPQYPAPSPAHAGAVAVPLPILAIDAGQRWLYAPPRIAVVRWPTAEAVGVGDAPGFDPERWPPTRLGDWPPATVREWDQARLAGAIERFTAIWGRLVDVWFGGERYLQLDDERLEALLLLALLLPEPMLAIYAEISPDFWAWLRGDQIGSG
jgi:hypothetical protein